MSSDTTRETVGDLGEEALISRLIAQIPSHPSVLQGPGDDCAVIETGCEFWSLLKTDSMVEGIHFSPGTDPQRVGRKAMNRALSDIAAMGGLPGQAVIAISLNEERSVDEVEGWYVGLLRAASESGVAIVGGETTRLPGSGAVLTVSLLGTVEPECCVPRSGASAGDLIAVTGRLGGSFVSGRHLDFIPRVREARWLVKNACPTAMMDLSDGLGSDLPRLADASGTGYRIDRSAIPCHEGVSVEQAIAEGEDYELLLCIHPKRFQKMSGAWEREFPDVPLSVIGQMTESERDELPRGWEHYRKG